MAILGFSNAAMSPIAPPMGSLPRTAGKLRVIWGLFLILTGSVGATSWSSDPSPSPKRLLPRFEPVEMVDFPVTIPSSYRAETGYLVVLENRDAPQGPTIRLPVAIVRAKNQKSDASPVLYLVGGPGSSALNAAAYPGAYPWVSNRDFVVLEQRGTRHAQPSLECPEFDRARQGASYSSHPRESLKTKVAATTRCRDRWTAEGVDLTAYNSAESAADIEDLRQVLGIQKWTLYGLSYGTRLALTVMRDYPASVRATVLVSVLPPQVNYDDESTLNYEAALGRVFRDCEASEACRNRFPQLRERFYDSIQRANRQPLEVALEGDQKPRTRSLNGADLAGLTGLFDTAAIADAPRTLDVIARQDLAALATEFGGGEGPSSWALGMRFSVWCSEELPFSVRAKSEGPGLTLAGLESAAVAPEICAAWKVPSRPSIESKAVKSEVPTLLISGEYDSATPPAWAERAALTLPRSRSVVLRGAGHVPTQEWGGDGCAMKLAAQFVEDPSTVVSPDYALPDCWTTRTPPEFHLEPKP